MTSDNNSPQLPSRRSRRRHQQQTERHATTPVPNTSVQPHEPHTTAGKTSTAGNVPAAKPLGAPSWRPVATPKQTPKTAAKAIPPTQKRNPKTPQGTAPKTVGGAQNPGVNARANAGAKARGTQPVAPKRPPVAKGNPVARAAKPVANVGATGSVKPKKQPQKKKGNSVWRWIRRVLMTLFLLFLLGVIAACGLFLYQYWKIQIPTPEKSAQGQITTVYFADGRTKLGILGNQNRIIIDTAELPEYVGQAVVASEDRTFFQNNGVDFKGIARALWNNVQGKPRQGASTLSQQYVERYYTGQNSTYFGKFKETILALKINRTQSKQEILNNYLNTIYFGRGAYGIEAASQAYFHKPAKDLDVSEAAMLAGIIPAPSAWDPAKDPKMAEARWKRVIKNMVTDGWLQAAEASKLKFPKVLEKPQQPDYLKGPNGYLLNQVKRELEQRVGYSEDQLNNAGIKVITTIDPAMQQKIIATAQSLPADKPQNLRVAMTAINPQTGAIVAEYAGPDYLKIQSNAATQDRAQAGSTFKAFTLLAALEKGYSLDKVMNGNSVKVGGKMVNNYGGYQYGMISLRTALRFSVNGVFIRLNEQIGPEATKNTAIKAGIPKDTLGLQDNITNTLGTSSPHNIDLAHAYATFAAGGVNRSPHIIARVLNGDGDETYHWMDDGKQVFQQMHVAALNEAMSGVCQEDRKYTRYYKQCGAKTGSAEDNKAAQFVGYTPKLATAVSLYQVGPNGEEQSITPFGGEREIIGSTFPAQLWGRWMNSVDGMNAAGQPVQPDLTANRRR